MNPYFRSVQVVERLPPDAVNTPHVVADIRLDGGEARDLTTGRLTYVTLRMQRAFAIRPSEASEYTFTFAGVANSDHQYRTLDEGCEQMMLEAVGGLLREWGQDEVFNGLVNATAPSAPAPAAVTPE